MIDVLLTPDENQIICDFDCPSSVCDAPMLLCYRHSIAAQHKLLGVLKEKCEEHPIPVPAEYGVPEPAGFAYVNRANCPKCMAEIEEALK